MRGYVRMDSGWAREEEGGMWTVSDTPARKRDRHGTWTALSMETPLWTSRSFPLSLLTSLYPTIPYYSHILRLLQY
jgi:hypothetical protein